ncbi:MAG: carboxypeptidase-like regulatory domain-containing protein [Planctomycetaceae bacterium]
MSLLKWLLIGAVMTPLAGCGSSSGKPADDVYPVTGRLTLGGKPVEGADLTFFNSAENRTAFGRTDADGNYQLTTFTANDGAVAGEYVVTIMKGLPAPTVETPDVESAAYVPPGMHQSTDPTPPKNSFPAMYADQASSGLKATVKSEGENVVNFELP